MPKSRSRARFSWKQEYGGVPAWGIAAAVGLLAVILAAPAVVNATTPEAAPYVRPSDAFDEPGATQTVEAQKIAFLGDSWAGGAGSDEAGAINSYAGKAGTALGGPFEVFPGGGTGYTTGNAATSEGPFIERVPALIEFAPDVVVVQGSSNDYQASAEQIEASALEVFTAIKAGLPDATVYVVGVIDSPSSPVDRMDVSRAAVSAAAATAGVTWVDANAEGWLDINTDFADGYHPNEQGHQKVADRLVTLLAG